MGAEIIFTAEGEGGAGVEEHYNYILQSLQNVVNWAVRECWQSRRNCSRAQKLDHSKMLFMARLEHV